MNTNIMPSPANATRPPSRDLYLLILGQGLTAAVTALQISILALAGQRLAPAPGLATLPVSVGVLGTLLAIYPAAMLMRRMGRRSGFLLKAALGAAGGIIACLGMAWNVFALLSVGALLLGVFSAFGQYYRFAAIDAATSAQQRAAAVAWVTLGGVAGGLLGPWLAGHYAMAITALPYAGGFIAIVALCLLLAISQSLLSPNLGRAVAASVHDDTAGGQGRGLSAAFYRVGVICAVGFVTMTLTMTAAPLTLHAHGHDVANTAFVMQAHFVSMYLPSLFLPWLTRSLGLRGVIACGLGLGAAGCLLPLLPAQQYGLFVLELSLSGIAWNFVFLGGTLLLGQTHAAAVKDRAQGINSLLVYGANIVASFSAGWLVNASGWAGVNLAALPLIALAAVCLARSART